VSRSNYNEDGKLTAATERIDLADEKPPRSKPQFDTSEKTAEFEEDEACIDENDLEGQDKEVYIQAVAEGSLAAADGRLFQGDILLQVSKKTFFFFLKQNLNLLYFQTHKLATYLFFNSQGKKEN
jgi:hypothetical protein